MVDSEKKQEDHSPIYSNQSELKEDQSSTLINSSAHLHSVKDGGRSPTKHDLLQIFKLKLQENRKLSLSKQTPFSSLGITTTVTGTNDSSELNAHTFPSLSGFLSSQMSETNQTLQQSSMISNDIHPNEFVLLKGSRDSLYPVPTIYKPPISLFINANNPLLSAGLAAAGFQWLSQLEPPDQHSEFNELPSLTSQDEILLTIQDSEIYLQSLVDEDNKGYDGFNNGLGDHSVRLRSIVGKLTSMCSYDEMIDKQRTSTANDLERLPASLYSDPEARLVNRHLVAKSFQRSDANKVFKASDVRPLIWCRKTIHNLLSLHLSADYYPLCWHTQRGSAVNGKLLSLAEWELYHPCVGIDEGNHLNNLLPSTNKLTYSYLDVYNFLRDRFRSVWQDMTVQHCSKHQGFIESLEITFRFLVLSEELLCEEKAFNATQNGDLMNTCLDKLMGGYADSRYSRDSLLTLFSSKLGLHSKKQFDIFNVLVYHSPHEAEFWAYKIIMTIPHSIENSNAILDMLRKIPIDLRQDKRIRFAFAAHKAFRDRNSRRYFKILRRADYLFAILLHKFAHLMRVSYLEVLTGRHSRQHPTVPFKQFCRQFGFEYESLSTIQSFCYFYRLSFEPILPEHQFIQNDYIPTHVNLSCAEISGTDLQFKRIRCPHFRSAYLIKRWSDLKLSRQTLLDPDFPTTLLLKTMSSPFPLIGDSICPPLFSLSEHNDYELEYVQGNQLSSLVLSDSTLYSKKNSFKSSQSMLSTFHSETSSINPQGLNTIPIGSGTIFKNISPFQRSSSVLIPASLINKTLSIDASNKSTHGSTSDVANRSSFITNETVFPSVDSVLLQDNHQTITQSNLQLTESIDRHQSTILSKSDITPPHQTTGVPIIKKQLQYPFEGLISNNQEQNCYSDSLSHSTNISMNPIKASLKVETYDDEYFQNLLPEPKFGLSDSEMSEKEAVNESPVLLKTHRESMKTHEVPTLVDQEYTMSIVQNDLITSTANQSIHISVSEELIDSVPMIVKSSERRVMKRKYPSSTILTDYIFPSDDHIPDHQKSSLCHHSDDDDESHLISTDHVYTQQDQLKTRAKRRLRQQSITNSYGLSDSSTIEDIPESISSTECIDPNDSNLLLDHRTIDQQEFQFPLITCLTPNDIIHITPLNAHLFSDLFALRLPDYTENQTFHQYIQNSPQSFMSEKLYLKIRRLLIFGLKSMDWQFLWACSDSIVHKDVKQNLIPLQPEDHLIRQNTHHKNASCIPLHQDRPLDRKQVNQRKSIHRRSLDGLQINVITSHQFNKNKVTKRSATSENSFRQTNESVKKDQILTNETIGDQSLVSTDVQQSNPVLFSRRFMEILYYQIKLNDAIVNEHNTHNPEFIPLNQQATPTTTNSDLSNYIKNCIGFGPIWSLKKDQVLKHYLTDITNTNKSLELMNQSITQDHSDLKNSLLSVSIKMNCQPKQTEESLVDNTSDKKQTLFDTTGNHLFSNDRADCISPIISPQIYMDWLFPISSDTLFTHVPFCPLSVKTLKSSKNHDIKKHLSTSVNTRLLSCPACQLHTQPSVDTHRVKYNTHILEEHQDSVQHNPMIKPLSLYFNDIMQSSACVIWVISHPVCHKALLRDPNILAHYKEDSTQQDQTDYFIYDSTWKEEMTALQIFLHLQHTNTIPNTFNVKNKYPFKVIILYSVINHDSNTTLCQDDLYIKEMNLHIHKAFESAWKSLDSKKKTDNISSNLLDNAISNDAIVQTPHTETHTIQTEHLIASSLPWKLEFPFYTQHPSRNQIHQSADIRFACFVVGQIHYTMNRQNTVPNTLSKRNSISESNISSRSTYFDILLSPIYLIPGAIESIFTTLRISFQREIIQEIGSLLESIQPSHKRRSSTVSLEMTLSKDFPTMDKDTGLSKNNSQSRLDSTLYQILDCTVTPCSTLQMIPFIKFNWKEQLSEPIALIIISSWKRLVETLSDKTTSPNVHCLLKLLPEAIRRIDSSPYFHPFFWNYTPEIINSYLKPNLSSNDVDDMKGHMTDNTVSPSCIITFFRRLAEAAVISCNQFLSSSNDLKMENFHTVGDFIAYVRRSVRVLVDSVVSDVSSHIKLPFPLWDELHSASNLPWKGLPFPPQCYSGNWTVASVLPTHAIYYDDSGAKLPPKTILNDLKQSSLSTTENNSSLLHTIDTKLKRSSIESFGTPPRQTQSIFPNALTSKMCFALKHLETLSKLELTPPEESRKKSEIVTKNDTNSSNHNIYVDTSSETINNIFVESPLARSRLRINKSVVSEVVYNTSPRHVQSIFPLSNDKKLESHYQSPPHVPNPHNDKVLFIFRNPGGRVLGRGDHMTSPLKERYATSLSSPNILYQSEEDPQASFAASDTDNASAFSNPSFSSSLPFFGSKSSKTSFPKHSSSILPTYYRNNSLSSSTSFFQTSLNSLNCEQEREANSVSSIVCDITGADARIAELKFRLAKSLEKLRNEVRHDEKFTNT